MKPTTVPKKELTTWQLAIKQYHDEHKDLGFVPLKKDSESYKEVKKIQEELKKKLIKN